MALPTLFVDDGDINDDDDNNTDVDVVVDDYDYDAVLPRKLTQ